MSNIVEINYLTLVSGHVFTVRSFVGRKPDIFFHTKGGDTTYQSDGLERRYIKLTPKKGLNVNCEFQAIESVTRANYERGFKLLMLDLGNHIYRSGLISVVELNPIIQKVIFQEQFSKKLDIFLSCFNFNSVNFSLPNFKLGPGATDELI